MTGQAIAAGHIRLKRAYEPPAPEDGTRVLVDRLWPRGVSKAEAAIDHWYKKIAPSTELRRWFGHDPAHWTEFQHRYGQELQQQDAMLEEIAELARHGVVTLVFGARDEAHNDAVVLRDMLLRRGQAHRPRTHHGGQS